MLSTVTTKGQVTISKPIRDALGIGRPQRPDRVHPGRRKGASPTAPDVESLPGRGEDKRSHLFHRRAGPSQGGRRRNGQRGKRMKACFVDTNLFVNNRGQTPINRPSPLAINSPRV